MRSCDTLKKRQHASPQTLLNSHYLLGVQQPLPRTCGCFCNATWSSKATGHTLHGAWWQDQVGHTQRSSQAAAARRAIPFPAEALAGAADPGSAQRGHGTDIGDLRGLTVPFGRPEHHVIYVTLRCHLFFHQRYFMSHTWKAPLTGCWSHCVQVG